MKRTMLFLFAAALAAQLLGEDGEPAAPPAHSTPSALTPDQQLSYLQTLNQYQQAQAAYEKGLTEDQKKLVSALSQLTQLLQSAQQSLIAACGASQDFVMSNGIPVCQLKSPKPSSK